jgi:2-deoxy-D-gluconate 3-dehydrogenase
VTWGPFSLQGHAALVTGAARGIGRGIVVRMLEAGADVVAVDINPDARAALAGVLADDRVITADIGLASGHDAIVAQAREQVGRVDILVNCAGVYPPAAFLDVTAEFFDRLYGINLRGLALMTKAFAAALLAEGGTGKVVNIASVDGVRPSRRAWGSVYGATKGGVIALTAHLARELGDQGIGVNGISPGLIASEGAARDRSGEVFSPEEYQKFLDQAMERTVQGRFGTPDDIAKVAVFLASPAADYISGQIIVVDNGWMNS